MTEEIKQKISVTNENKLVKDDELKKILINSLLWQNMSLLFYIIKI